MRRTVLVSALVSLLMAGCGAGNTAKEDTAAARDYLRKTYSNVQLDIHLLEGPEYADVPKIPRDNPNSRYPDQSAACGVRVKFTWHDGGRHNHDDWVIWVSREHKAVGWTSNTRGDQWREWVQSFARK